MNPQPGKFISPFVSQIKKIFQFLKYYVWNRNILCSHVVWPRLSHSVCNKRIFEYLRSNGADTTRVRGQTVLILPEPGVKRCWYSITVKETSKRRLQRRLTRVSGKRKRRKTAGEGGGRTIINGTFRNDDELVIPVVERLHRLLSGDDLEERRSIDWQWPWHKQTVMLSNTQGHLHGHLLGHLDGGVGTGSPLHISHFSVISEHSFRSVCPVYTRDSGWPSQSSDMKG